MHREESEFAKEATSYSFPLPPLPGPQGATSDDSGKSMDSADPTAPLAHSTHLKHDAARQEQDDDREYVFFERMEKARKVIRAANLRERERKATPRRKGAGLHELPWNERSVFPSRGADGRLAQCCCFAAPHFWVRLEWALRAAIVAILPTSILELHPSTSRYFSQAGVAWLVTDMAYWISAPHLGDGLREACAVMKGWSLSLAIMCLVTLIDLRSPYVFIPLYAAMIFGISVLTDQARNNACFIIALLLLQFQTDPSTRRIWYIGEFLYDLFIGLAFGVVALLFPLPNWSLRSAQEHYAALSNMVSTSLQGIAATIWASKLEVQLNAVDLLQVRETMKKTLSIANTRLEEAYYEPHAGLLLAQVEAVKKLLTSLTRILYPMLDLIEFVAEHPVSETMKHFGEEISMPLTLYLSAIDKMVLIICDKKKEPTEAEIDEFKRRRDVWERALWQARISYYRELCTSSIEQDEFSIAGGFFLYGLREFGAAIERFSMPKDAPNRARALIRFPVTELTWLGQRIITIAKFWSWSKETRQVMKMAIRTTTAMTICVSFRFIFPDRDSALADATFLPFIMSRNAADTFIYATQRVLGTAIAGVFSYVVVELSTGNISIIVGARVFISLFGVYIQSSNEFSAAGGAAVWTGLSILRQTGNSESALLRLQQNTVSLIIYFIVVSLLWRTDSAESIRKRMFRSFHLFRAGLGQLLDSLSGSVVFEDISKEVKLKVEELGILIEEQDELVKSAIVEPTILGAKYPDEPVRRIIRCQHSLCLVLSMMRYSYRRFLSSHDRKSLHWRLLRAIAIPCSEITEEMYSVMELQITKLKGEQVSTSQLVGLREALKIVTQQLMEEYNKEFKRALTDVLTPESPQKRRQTEGEQTELPTAASAEDQSFDAGASAGVFTTSSITSSIAPLRTPLIVTSADGSTATLSSANEHAIEAIVFGVQAVTHQVGIMEKALHEMLVAQALGRYF